MIVNPIPKYSEFSVLAPVYPIRTKRGEQAPSSSIPSTTFFTVQGMHHLGGLNRSRKPYQIGTPL
jgi:hypothetical protein